MRYSEMSMADIVKDHPESASLFDSRNLDYCCNGKGLLKDAFVNNLEELLVFEKDLNELIERSNRLEKINYDAIPVAQLIDLIVGSHHAYIKNSSPVILSHLERLIERHAEDYTYLKEIRDLFYQLSNEAAQHMMKEELILFPRIKSVLENPHDKAELISKSNITMLISVMESEHGEAGDMMKKIKERTNDYTAPSDACTTFKLVYNELRNFEKNLHLHVHLENNILFPRVLNKK